MPLSLLGMKQGFPARVSSCLGCGVLVWFLVCCGFCLLVVSFYWKDTALFF